MHGTLWEKDQSVARTRYSISSSLREHFPIIDHKHPWFRNKIPEQRNTHTYNLPRTANRDQRERQHPDAPILEADDALRVGGIIAYVL